MLNKAIFLLSSLALITAQVAVGAQSKPWESPKLSEPRWKCPQYTILDGYGSSNANVLKDKGKITLPENLFPGIDYFTLVEEITPLDLSVSQTVLSSDDIIIKKHKELLQLVSDDKRSEVNCKFIAPEFPIDSEVKEDSKKNKICYYRVECVEKKKSILPITFSPSLTPVVKKAGLWLISVAKEGAPD